MKAPTTPLESLQGDLKGKQGRTSGPARRSTKGQWTPEEVRSVPVSFLLSI
jgi:myb proto-oncogene protein